jgi:hypothetical protein
MMQRRTPLYQLSAAAKTNINQSNEFKMGHKGISTKHKIQNTLRYEINELLITYNSAFELAVSCGEKYTEKNQNENEFTYKTRVLLWYLPAFVDKVGNVLKKKLNDDVKGGGFKNYILDFQRTLEGRYNNLFLKDDRLVIQLINFTYNYQSRSFSNNPYPYGNSENNKIIGIDVKEVISKKPFGNSDIAAALALYLEDIVAFELTILEMENVLAPQVYVNMSLSPIDAIKRLINYYNYFKTSGDESRIDIALEALVTYIVKLNETFVHNQSKHIFYQHQNKRNYSGQKNTVAESVEYIKSGFLYKAIKCLCNGGFFADDLGDVKPKLIKLINDARKLNETHRFFQRQPISVEQSNPSTPLSIVMKR